jgi:hypothetical protein
MKELNIQEVEAVNGGIFINPWTVIIAVRCAQIAAPYVQAGAIAAVGVVCGALGYDAATKESK